MWQTECFKFIYNPEFAEIVTFAPVNKLSLYMELRNFFISHKAVCFSHTGTGIILFSNNIV